MSGVAPGGRLAADAHAGEQPTGAVMIALGLRERGEEQHGFDREGPGTGSDDEVQVWFRGAEAHDVGIGELLEVAGAQVHVEVVVGCADGEACAVGSVASAEHVAFVLADVSDE